MKVQDVKKVGVAGSGLMGHGIAVNSAIWGYPTMMYDISEDVLKKAMKDINADLNIFVEEGLITREHAAETERRITTTADIAKFAANCDFITEAIVERSKDKFELFNKLDTLCPPHTIIASNTSSLVLSDFARGAKRQDKIVLTHYFSPADFVPGVEVAKGPGASDESFNITYELMKKWHKAPIKVLKEYPGYVVNSLQFALMRQADILIGEGVVTAEELDRGFAATAGFRMPHEGPVMRGDMSGGWRWPKDIRIKMVEERMAALPAASSKVMARLKADIETGKPALLDANKMDDEFNLAYREYARRLKDLYWGKQQ